MTTASSGPPAIHYRSAADRLYSIATIARTLRIVEEGGAHYIEDVLTGAGRPRRWQAAFASHAAARVFRHDMILAVVDGVDNDACGFEGLFEYYELAGKVLEIVEAHRGDALGLATSIARTIGQPPGRRSAEQAEESET